MTEHHYTELLHQIQDDSAFWAEVLTSEFTEELARLMEAENINRAQLAALVGTKPSYITRVLNGNTNFTALTMARLAHALGARVAVHLAPKDADVRWNDVWHNELPFQAGRSAPCTTEGSDVSQDRVEVSWG